MTRSILVPLDGSHLSEQAIPFAHALAKAMDADVLFMRAVLTAAFSPSAARFNQDLREQGRRYLDQHIADARGLGLRADGHLWEDEAGYAILKMVETHDPAFIVMSTHGRSGLGRVVWGSVADYVLHHTPVPMVLIPRSIDVHWNDMQRPRFVVPLDGSALSEEALHTAEDLAHAFGGQIELIQAIEPNTWILEAGDPWASYSFEPTAFDLESQQTSSAGKYLDGIANHLNQKGVTASVSIIPGHPASVVRQAARDNHAAAIIMATHGRGGPSRLLMGSVTDAVVRTARVPVFVIRPAVVRQETTQSPPRTSTADRSLILSMSPAELDLTRIALRQLVNTRHAGVDLAQVRDLLAGVRRHDSALPHAGVDLAQASELLERMNQIQAPERIPGAPADDPMMAGSTEKPSR